MALGAELGFWISKPHWGRGYATETATAMIDWHFQMSNGDAIASSAHHLNKASLRVKAKLGFTETGRDRRFSQALQCNVEHVLTRLTREDWMAGRERECA